MEYTVEYLAEERAFYVLVPSIMGTRFEMIIYGKEQSEAVEIWREIATKLEGWHKMLNRFDPESEVAKINGYNDTSDHAISGELEEIIVLCREYWQRTEHLFDITRHNMAELVIGERCLRKKQSEITLDFGGFAKGYALLKIRQQLQEKGVERAIIDFGRSTIMTLNTASEDKGWRISLPSTYDGREVAEFQLRNCTLSTSGNTPSYSGHIINPQSGEKIEERVLCSVIAENPLDAEVMSTVGIVAERMQMERIIGGFENITAKTYYL